MSADAIYYNGHVYTADNKDSIHEAVAIKDGFILAVGTNKEIQALAGSATEKNDLKGAMIIPGIIDSHMHPLWGAKMLANHTLKYASLTVEETLDRVRGFLQMDGPKGDDSWLQVRAWLRIGGSDVTRDDLDSLSTNRPIILFSNDCHFITLNSKALTILGIDENTPDPNDGAILRDSNRKPTGIIEDAPAMRAYDKVSAVSGQSAADVLGLAQVALHKQGVTTVMDTRAEDEAFQGWSYMRDQGSLSLRVLGSREVTPYDCPTPADAEKAIQAVKAFADKYNVPKWTPKPDLAVTQAKFFVDGMPTNLTAYTLTPYLENKGTDEKPDWQPGTKQGVPYFPEENLKSLFVACAKYDLSPHMHVIADGAIEITLNALEAMRKAYPDKDIRPAMAHSDVVLPRQYKRYAELKAYPVLSFQWAGQPDELIELQKNMYGPERFSGLETHGKFIDAGCKVAYGSDWPIDPLNEWNNFQVGLTRRMVSGDDTVYPRLDNDRDLTVREVLRSATIVAAEAIHKDTYIGSLEKGKFADLAVVDRDLFKTPSDQFAKVKVLRTVVGGKTVYTA